MVMLSLGLPRLPPRFTDTVPFPLPVPVGEPGVCGLSGGAGLTGELAPPDAPVPSWGAAR